MDIGPFTTLGALLGLALGAGACAPHSGTAAPSPTRTFRTIAEAKDCARDALASAGFLPETRVLPGPDGGVVPGETPTSISGRIITPLGNGMRIDYASAGARLRIERQGDTTVTVGVSVQTLLWDDQHSGALQPLSSTAVRARDAVVTQCQGSAGGPTYPRSS